MVLAHPACQLSSSPPSLSPILCNDVIQWADHVGSMSACLRVPLLLRQGVFPLLLSCRRELKPPELHLCDIMAVLRRVCGSLHCGCCRIRDIKPPEDALNPAADDSSLKDTYYAHFQVFNFILGCTWNIGLHDFLLKKHISFLFEVLSLYYRFEERELCRAYVTKSQRDYWWVVSGAVYSVGERNFCRHGLFFFLSFRITYVHTNPCETPKDGN